MNSHTQGPWKSRDDYAGAKSVVAGNTFVCRVGPPNTEEAHANASLIAAAPDLLEALHEIIAINEEDQGTFRKRGGTRRGLSIVAARAAIAKATGDAA